MKWFIFKTGKIKGNRKALHFNQKLIKMESLKFYIQLLTLIAQ